MSLNNPKQTTQNPTFFKKCRQCDRKIVRFYQICNQCRNEKMVSSISLSDNNVIDTFIRYTLANHYKNGWRMEFVPYSRFKDVKFIAEGGFSKVYKATWVDGPITHWNDYKQEYNRCGKTTVALKELNNSKNINSIHLNEVPYNKFKQFINSTIK
uniref:Protein kinase domain-containing protein n=1 Tax=Rhizophagus irregularis (strain DAOM 181602 / DAOM 197198 / MUCL 43194) TaxID=747089 RepID=U9T643_RHIID